MQLEAEPEVTLPDHTVIGAGPAGLVAATTLARAGRQVRVYERSSMVGHRFAGDFQGLENWSTSTDVLERLAHLEVEPTFEYKPFHEITFYDSALRPAVARSVKPFFYLVRRGPEDGSLDRALLAQARDAGVDVLLGQPASHARRGDIVAIGPRFADGIATGYVFSTDLEDQAHCVISEDLAPAGYAYLLVWNGRATLATCLFQKQDNWKEARGKTVETFSRLVPGIDLSAARPFSGYGSVFASTGFTDEGGRIFVGEAAGLQDPEWGFGMWYAMESGALAALSLLEGFDYDEAAGNRFDSRREAALFNRLLFERLPAMIVPTLLKKNVESTDLLGRLGRHWQPNILKSAIAKAALPHFSRTRLKRRDRACHSETCECVWCTHGEECTGSGTCCSRESVALGHNEAVETSPTSASTHMEDIESWQR
ncbi:MAG: NAD(P)/FAD-dependent oxidoreductase [Acidimicrobiia bacterium]|nr:MAG: NAD(P)/FAD-dependent oxidoreductase [Acidimicrobiia bacterium]